MCSKEPVQQGTSVVFRTLIDQFSQVEPAFCIAQCFLDCPVEERTVRIQRYIFYGREYPHTYVVSFTPRFVYFAPPSFTPGVSLTHCPGKPSDAPPVGREEERVGLVGPQVRQPPQQLTPTGPVKTVSWKKHTKNNVPSKNKKAVKILLIKNWNSLGLQIWRLDEKKYS